MNHARRFSQRVVLCTLFSFPTLVASDIDPAHAASVAQPIDDRASSLLVDQAVATLAALRTDSADDSALFGIPTPEQRKHVEQAARSALALLQEAESKTASAIKQLEDRLIGKQTPSPEETAKIEAALTRLVDVEQTQRIPLHRGIAHALLAASIEGPPRDEARRASVAILGKLHLPDQAADDVRAVWLAGALLQTHDLDDQTRRAINEQLQAVIAREKPPLLPDNQCSLARIALLSLGEDQSCVSYGPAPFLRCEALARGHLLMASRDATRKVELAAQACRDLCLYKPDSAGPPAVHQSWPMCGNDLAKPITPAQRLTIYAKIATMIDGSVPFAQLPAEAGFARAVTLLREVPDSAEAAAILNGLADRTDIPDLLKPDIAWERLVMLARRTDQNPADFASNRRETESLLDFLGKYAKDPRSADAERRAAALIDSPLWQTPEGRTAWRANAAALDRFAELALQKYPTPRRAEQVYQRRLKALADQPSSKTANELAYCLGGASEARTGEIRAALVKPLADVGATEVLNYARELDRLFDNTPGLRTAAADLALADGYARSNDGTDERRAADLYRTGMTADGPRATLGLAGLQRRTGDAAAAIVTLRSLVDRIDASNAPSHPLPTHYWRAWAEIIEIEHTLNAPDLLAHIKRLELLDPNLGGTEIAKRIRAVRDQMK